MTLDQRLAVVVLAAGRGSRMGTNLPKPLIEVGGAPMVSWVLDSAAQLSPQRILCVVPSAPGALSRELRPLDLVVQSVPDGPGGALRATEARLRGFAGDILVLPADAPMIDPELLRAALAARRGRVRPVIVVCGGHLERPAGYGRLKLDGNDRLLSIVEEREASAAERSSNLCNLGPMVVDAESLWPLLEGLTRDNSAGEYYSTDMVAAANEAGARCSAVLSRAGPMLSVNTPAQRDEVDRLMRGRARPSWRARRFRTVSSAVRDFRSDLSDPDKGFVIVRSVISEAEAASYLAKRMAELDTLPSGRMRINNERMFDYIHHRSHDEVDRTTRIYKFLHNAEEDEQEIYDRVLRIRRTIEAPWRRDPTYRDIADSMHSFNIVTAYRDNEGMLPRHRDHEGPISRPLLQCLILLTARPRDYEGGDFRLVNKSGSVISANRDMKLRQGDLLLFDKSLEHEIGPSKRGGTGVGRWSLIVGVRAPAIATPSSWS